MSVRVDVKRTPGKLSFLARGRTAEAGVGEVYINGVNNIRKAAYLSGLGHDPMHVPDEILRTAREFVKQGAITHDQQTMRRTITAAAQYVARFLRTRITSGALGVMARSTVQKKLWKIAMGLATARYGIPGPYGIETGRLVRSILGRWRPSRGNR